MDVNRPRPLLKTITAKGAFLSFAATVLLAFANTASNIATRHFPNNKEDIADLLNFINQIGIIAGLSGGVGAIAGRATATAPTYTPEWFPGPSREDLFDKYESAKETAEAIEKSPNIPDPPGVALTPTVENKIHQDR